MKKKVLAILFILMISASFAQEYNAQEYDVSKESSFLHENDGKKHYLTALSFIPLLNTGIHCYNRFISGGDWSKVTWDDVSAFYEKPFEWDGDWYWTNFVLHPYQGSLYYMAARSSNLTKVESFAFTVLGSAYWEYLCETNAPSVNDMVYTTVGAFCVGEMLYRLSLNSDEISQIIGCVINPTRLWTQLLTRQKPLGSTRSIHELSLRLSLGNAFGHTNLIDYEGDYHPTEIYPVFFSPELYIAYHDPYGHDSDDAYSQFEFLLKGAIGTGSGYGADCNFAELDKKLFYDIRIFSNGMLFSRAPDFGENKDTTIGVVMEYDFDWHSYYLLSSLAPGFAIKQRIRYDNDSKLEWQAHLAAVILGTSDFYYYRRDFDPKYADSNRVGRSAPYNYNLGFETKLLAKYQTEKGSAFKADFKGYALYDFYNQLQFLNGNERGTQPGWDLIGITNLSAEFALTKKVKIGIEDEIYTKFALYDNISNVFQIANTVAVFAKIQAK